MRASFDFSGARVVVTGASRGIGLGIAQAYAAAGADLFILANDADIAGAAEDLARQSKRPVRSAVADISRQSDLDDVFRDIGRIDVLVNNAGLELMTQIDDASDEVESVFRRIVDINVTGTFLTSRTAVKYMDGAGASIVNTASIWGRTAEAGFSAYVASKHGVLGLVRSWAKEFAPRILVNAICPGPIDTEMLGAANMSAEWREKELAIPLARFGRPEEVAELSVFLAGSGGRYFTGQGLGINGGSIMP